jgi:hypothetical protein
MMNKEQTELRQEQINSLKWAVDELEKEKNTIAARSLKIREASGLQTSLQEAISEQQSLNTRINEMEGGLREIEGDEHESLSAEELAAQQASLQERIAIASERLSVLEQERELESIALRFRGEPAPVETDIDQEPINRLSKELETTQNAMEETTTENRLQIIDSIDEPENAPRARVTETKPLVTVGSGSLACTEATSQGLREASADLDLDPEYLLDKSVQAVLRMFERNKNRVTFPLEVKQIDAID